MTREPTIREWRHYSGVHTECKPASWGRDNDTPESCRYAGKIERIHSHDFPGPSCPCEELPPNAGSAS